MELSRGLPLKLLTVAAIASCAAWTSQSANAQAQTAGNGGAPRDPWRLQPSLSIDESWSDNINLASPGNERSDFVTTISPALRLTRLGSRLSVNLFYQPQYFYYARGTNGGSLRNYLSASGNATLVDNLLFFDALASVSQQNVSPFGSLAANTVNGSNNRAESRNYSFGPTLRSRFGNDLSYNAGYRYTSSTYDSNQLSGSHTSAISAGIQSGTSSRDLGGGLTYNRSDQVFAGANEIIVESLGSNLTYVLSPTIHLRTGVGYDRNRYPALPNRDLSGLSYFGGFDWNPTRHTRVSAQVGHRYFGPTANISINETTAHTSLTVIYTRDQTTSSASGLALVANPQYALLDQFLLAAIPDPVRRAQAVTGILQQSGLPTSQFGVTGFLSNQIFVQKRFEVSLGLFGLRNSVTLDAYRTQSQVLSNLSTTFDVFNQATNFRQTGYSVNWSYKLGPLTNVSASALKTHSSAISGTGDSRQRVLSVSANRQIQKNLTGSVQYRNTRQDGNTNNVNNSSANAGNVFSGNYRENAVLGSLRLTF